MRSFFWSLFSWIWTEYGDLRSKSPYSVWIQENKDQKKLRIWKLFTQWNLLWKRKNSLPHQIIICQWFCLNNKTNRSSLPEVLLGKGVLKIHSKFTGEHPCWSAISNEVAKPLYWNHISAWVFSCKFAAYFRTCFPKNTCFST